MEEWAPPWDVMYHQQIREVADIKKLQQWLENADLKDSTEALVTAAQEQPKAQDPEKQGSITAERTAPAMN